MGILSSKGRHKLEETNVTYPYRAKCYNALIIGPKDRFSVSSSEEPGKISYNRSLMYALTGSNSESAIISVGRNALQVWDTQVSDELISECAIFIITFSLQDRRSWYNVSSTYREISEKCSVNTQFFVVGFNDEDSNKQVASQEIEYLCNEMEAIYIQMHGDDDVKQLMDYIVYYVGY